MFTIRASADWNLANKQLGTEAAPRGARSKQIISEMLKDQQQLMAADAKILANESSMLQKVVLVATVIAAVVGIAVAWFITRMITRPIRQTVTALGHLSEGDLTQKLNIKSKDEFGDLSAAFNVLADKFLTSIGRISETATGLGTTSEQLNSTADQLASGATEATQASATVAAAAEEMSLNLKTVAGSTESVSTNVTTVSAAMEEMTATVANIARNAERSAAVAANAAELAKTTNGQIAHLGASADEIGSVIEVIQDIAEQTNLLALNATIEAARAGESGKGFAVVATEVKELAKQTAAATDDIGNRIEAIQGSSNQAVSAIQEISTVIDEVNEVARSIASAVEEQSITTKEISQNITSTATSTETVSTTVNESASASQEITHSILSVDDIAKQTASNAATTQQVGQELQSQAVRLRNLVSQFRIGNEQEEAQIEMTFPSSAPADIRDSFQRAVANRVFAKFYDEFVNSDDRIPGYFAKTDFAMQKRALQEGVATAIGYATGDSSSVAKVNALGTSHNDQNMNILPELYPLWLRAWLKTMSSADSQWNDALAQKWESMLQKAIDAMKAVHKTKALAGV